MVYLGIAHEAARAFNIANDRLVVLLTHHWAEFPRGRSLLLLLRVRSRLLLLLRLRRAIRRVTVAHHLLLALLILLLVELLLLLEVDRACVAYLLLFAGAGMTIHRLLTSILVMHNF